MANLINKAEYEAVKEQPEKRLWKAVLNQIFQDAFNDTYRSRNKGEKKHAIDYLKSMHQDYYMVCEYAGLDANYVHMKVKKKINLDNLKKLGVIWNYDKENNND